MLPAVLTALAAVLGVVIGRFWETRSEIGRDRRERRVAAYEDLCGYYFEVRERIRRLSSAAPDSPEAHAARGEVLDTGARWNKSVATVWLHSTGPVCAALGRLDHEINESVQRALDGEFSYPEWQVERQPTEEALEGFLESVRMELRRPPVPVRLRTYSVEELKGRVASERSASGPDR